MKLSATAFIRYWDHRGLLRTEPFGDVTYSDLPDGLYKTPDNSNLIIKSGQVYLASLAYCGALMGQTIEFIIERRGRRAFLKNDQVERISFIQISSAGHLPSKFRPFEEYARNL